MFILRYNYQGRNSEDKFSDSEEYYQINNQDQDRPRPMTSTEQQGQGRRYDNKYKTQNYHGGNDKFPTVESNTNTRAYSAKPYKGNEKMPSPNSRRLPENKGPGGLRNVTYALHSNKLTPSPSGDFSRMRPKNIMQDKERLYEETLHLKSIINNLKEDNLKYKTKISNLEKEASKFEKMIQESNTNFYRGDNPPPQKTTENYLTITLKQNIKEVRTTLKSREEELAEIKKTLKYTKVQEIEAQMKAFQDEALRLRTIMDHVMKEKAHIVLSDDDKNRLQEEYFVQATQLRTLKRDNEEMATAIKILEEQNFEYEKKITEQDKKYRREHNQHKKVLQEKEKELAKIRNDPMGAGSAGYPGQRRPMTTTGNRDDAFRQELEKKTSENNNLINQLAEKRNQILNLERQLRDLKTEYNEKITGAQNEKQALVREIEKLKNAKASGSDEAGKNAGNNDLKVQELKLDDYVRRASLQKNFSQDEKDNLLMYGQNSGTNASQNDKKQKGVPKKRVQKVRPEDVKDIGYELNLRLRIKKVTFDDIEKMIWPEKVRKAGVVTIKEMIEILRNDPFNMTNEDEVVLTSRYLIEDNENEFLYYDDTVKNDLHIVKSILKKMIGYLPPWDEARVRKIHQEISDMCIQNYGGLRENLKALCKNGFLTGSDLREACNLIDVTLTDEQVEYIITKLFEHSDNIHKLSIDRLFEIFSSKPKEIAADLESPRTNENRTPVQNEVNYSQAQPKNASLNESKPNRSIQEARRTEDEDEDDQGWREEEKDSKDNQDEEDEELDEDEGEDGEEQEEEEEELEEEEDESEEDNEELEEEEEEDDK